MAQFDSDYSGGEGASTPSSFAGVWASSISSPRVQIWRGRMWDATNLLVQGLMKVTDGMMVEESCEGEARVCFLVWLGVHWEQR